jgi:hypothetical protein
MIGKDPTTRVAIGAPVIITWGWNAKTETQIDDYLQNNITTITLDGEDDGMNTYGPGDANETQRDECRVGVE